MKNEYMSEYMEGMKPYFFYFSLLFGIISLIQIIFLYSINGYVFNPLAKLIAMLILMISLLGIVFGYLDYKAHKKIRSWFPIVLSFFGLFYSGMIFLVNALIGTGVII